MGKEAEKLWPNGGNLDPATVLFWIGHLSVGAICQTMDADHEHCRTRKETANMSKSAARRMFLEILLKVIKVFVNGLFCGPTGDTLVATKRCFIGWPTHEDKQIPEEKQP